MWAAAIAFLAGMLPWLVSRVITLLGFGVVTYYGLDVLVVQLQEFIDDQIGLMTSGLSTDMATFILAILNAVGFYEALQMIIAAYSAAFGLSVVTKLTGIKS